jgi:hypothetical protein
MNLPYPTNCPLIAGLVVVGGCYKIQNLTPKMHLSVLILQKELLPGQQSFDVLNRYF